MTNPVTKVWELKRQAFVLCPPLSLSMEQPNNQFMVDLEADGVTMDRDLAVNQFMNLVAIASQDAFLYMLPSPAELQDQSYVSNVAVTLPHMPNVAVMANFSSAPRRGEELVAAQFLNQIGFDIVMAPQYFEGEADLKHLGGNTYAGGVGMRSTRSFLDWFAEKFDANTIPVTMTNPYCYHLDGVLMTLPQQRMAACSSLIGKETMAQLEQHGSIADVSEHEAMLGVTNCVVVGSKLLAISRLDSISRSDKIWQDEVDKRAVHEKLAAFSGLEPVPVMLGEFNKSGADLSCMFLPLNKVNG